MRALVALTAAVLAAAPGGHVARVRHLHGYVARVDARSRVALVNEPRPGRLVIQLRDGRIAASADDGRRWRVLGRAPPFDALDLPFALRGRALLGTRDGGRTWRRVSDLPRETVRRIGGPVTAFLDFVDARLGFAAPSATHVFETRDGGRTWRRLRFSCGSFEYLGGLSFPDPRHGFAVCGGQPATIMQQREYLRTVDGGATWRRTAARIYSGYVDSLDYVSPRLGYQTSERGRLERLPDGRTLISSDDTDSYLGQSWADARHGAAALFHTGLVVSDDGGAAWRRAWSGDAPQAVAFLDARRALAIPSGNDVVTPHGALEASDDGGRTWRRRRSPLGLRIGTLTATPYGAIVTGGRRGRTIVAVSPDGSRWRSLGGFRPALAPWSLASPTPAVVVVLASDRLLLRTVDAGRAWHRARPPAGAAGLAFGTGHDGLLWTNGGALLRTRDGGRSWRRVELPVTSPVRSATMLGAARWWVATGCCLLRTADAGGRWDVIEERNPPSGAAFRTPTDGYADTGTAILRTSDGGVSWRGP